MNFINNFIPLLGSFISGFADLFFFPLIALAFLCTVPYMIRGFFKMR